MSDLPVTLREIFAARRRISGKVNRTVTELSPSLSDRLGVPVHLKMEHRQVTGSFKLRGAVNAVAGLSDKQRQAGVVAVSTGNYGRALAHAARLEGIRCVICMSRLVPDNKLREIERLGAEVRVVGRSQDEAQEEVDRLVREEGMATLPPFDHADVVAGQGTLGLEIMQDVPEAATIVVPVSGGGLAAGVACAVKGVSPSVSVLGVSMRRGAAMKASLDAGRPVQVEEFPSLADSLGGGIGLSNRFTFAMCQALLDDLLLLDEGVIAAAIRHGYEAEREILEGAGAVGLGAILEERIQPRGPVVVILSGRNIDMALHKQVVQGERTRFELGEAVS